MSLLKSNISENLGVALAYAEEDFTNRDFDDEDEIRTLQRLELITRAFRNLQQDGFPDATEDFVRGYELAKEEMRPDFDLASRLKKGAVSEDPSP